MRQNPPRSNTVLWITSSSRLLPAVTSQEIQPFHRKDNQPKNNKVKKLKLISSRERIFFFVVVFFKPSTVAPQDYARRFKYTFHSFENKSWSPYPSHFTVYQPIRKEELPTEELTDNHIGEARTPSRPPRLQTKVVYHI